MKTKKSGIFAIMAAALMVTTLLMTNCLEPIDMTGFQDGRSVLRITLGGGDGRTALPAPVGTKYFDGFSVTVTNKNDPSETENQTATDESGLNGLSFTVTLSETYTIDITASNSGKDVAFGTAETTIASANPSAVSVRLLPITADSSDDGSFNFTITLPNDSNATTATYSIIPDPDSTNHTNKSVTSGSPVSINAIEAGVYEIKIVISKTNHTTRTVTEKFHIYPTMTTNYTYDCSSNPLVQNQFTITYYLNDDTSNSDDNPITPDAGDNNTNIKWNQTIPTKPKVSGIDPLNGGEYFLGWFTESINGSKWVFADDIGTPNRVYENKKLYAHWGASNTGSQGAEISFEMSDIGASISYTLSAGTFTSSTNILELSLGNIDTGVTFTIDTSAIGSGNTLTVTKWLLNGTQKATTNNLTVDKTLLGVSNIGQIDETEYMITVIFTINGKDYSRIFTLNITQ